MIARLVLPALGRIQRPLAWTVFGIGLATFLGILVGLIAAGEPKVTALTGAAILLFEGVSAVMDVENELGSEGAAK